MKTLVFGGAALLMLAATPALAESPFDGTWKADVKSADMGKKPDVYLLKDGMYACESCVPAVHIKADGTDQSVTGHPYYDMESIKVVNDHIVQITQKKDGKVVATATDTVAPDNKTMTFEFSDSSATNSAPVTGKGTQTRVGSVPTGAHTLSGSWRTTSYSTVSDNGLTVSYKVDGNMLTMTTPTGQKYAAKVDGTDAPYSGDPGVDMVSVKKMGTHTMVETDKRAGKAISVTRMTVSADGKKMHVAIQNKERGTTMSFDAGKM